MSRMNKLSNHTTVQIENLWLDGRRKGQIASWEGVPGCIHNPTNIRVQNCSVFVYDNVKV